MNKNSKGPVLIISSEPDPHADEVQKHLIKAGVPFVRFNSNEISEESNIRYEMPPHEYVVTYKGKEYKLSDFRSIWYRKPHFTWDDHTKLTDQQGIELTYKHSERMSLIYNLMHEAESRKIYIMSPIKNIKYADNKLTQFRIAKEVGFTLPATYIGSSYKEIGKFLKEHPKTINKSLGTGTIEYGKHLMTFTTARFTTDYMQENKTVLDYPIQLQEEIEKKFELRITVVGKKVFTCKIDSQTLPETMIDWRVIHPDNLPHTIYSLPNEIKNLCLKLCWTLGLNFATIDMAVTPENKYIFFEINPNGQYLWIEERTGMPLSHEIATLLASR